MGTEPQRAVVSMCRQAAGEQLFLTRARVRRYARVWGSGPGPTKSPALKPGVQASFLSAISITTVGSSLLSAFCNLPLVKIVAWHTPHPPRVAGPLVPTVLVCMYPPPTMLFFECTRDAAVRVAVLKEKDVGADQAMWNPNEWDSRGILPRTVSNPRGNAFRSLHQRPKRTSNPGRTP